MPQVRLTQDAPEGAAGQVVLVSRSRAQDLVNAHLATRAVERTEVVEKTVRRPRTP